MVVTAVFDIAITTGRGGSRKLVWGGGQKRIFAPPNLPFPYIYHVKGGQFGGAKTYFCP